MKLVHLRGDDPCPDRVTCPNLYATDNGTYVVQGYLSDELDRSADQAVVEIPLTLIPEVAAHSHSDLVLTDRGTVLVRGTKLRDAEALTMIQLPDGEDAVEVAARALPALVEARG